MKNLVASLLLAFTVLTLSSQLVLAAATPAPATGVGPAGQDLLNFLGKTAVKGGLTTDPNASTDVTGIISGVINAILGLVGVIFFIMMMYAGIRWMTAEGVEQVIKESKDTIRSALIGIVVTMSAFLITNFVLNRLEGVTQGAVPAGGSGPAAPPPGGAGAPVGGSTAPTGTTAVPTGACYLNADPGCVETTASDCASQSGNFIGEGTQC